MQHLMGIEKFGRAVFDTLGVSEKGHAYHLTIHVLYWHISGPIFSPLLLSHEKQDAELHINKDIDGFLMRIGRREKENL